VEVRDVVAPIDSNDADDTVVVYVREEPRADPDGRAGLAVLEGLDRAIDSRSRS